MVHFLVLVPSHVEDHGKESIFGHQCVFAIGFRLKVCWINSMEEYFSYGK